MPSRLDRFAVLVIALSAAPCIMAAEFCVSTPTQLQAAIGISATNGEDDTIRLTGGTFTGVVLFSSSEARALHVAGGFAPGCLQAGASTTFDGQQAVKPMTIFNFAGGDVVVERLTFINGLSVTNGGGGLAVLSNGGDVHIEHNRFVANRANDRAGALKVSVAGGSMTIRNNLFYGNTANQGAGAVELGQSGGAAYVSNNTIFGNGADNGAPRVGGLMLANAATFVLSNNIVWGNTAVDDVDLYVYPQTSHVRVANDIGSVGGEGATPISVVEEQDTAPGFAPCAFPCLGFELARGSPLVDAGVNNPAGGLSSTDLAGKSRVIGPRVDIGAWENDVLLETGFD